MKETKQVKDLQQENESISSHVSRNNVHARANPTLAHEVILLDGEIRMMFGFDSW